MIDGRASAALAVTAASNERWGSALGSLPLSSSTSLKFCYPQIAASLIFFYQHIAAQCSLTFFDQHIAAQWHWHIWEICNRHISTSQMQLASHLQISRLKMSFLFDSITGLTKKHANICSWSTNSQFTEKHPIYEHWSSVYTEIFQTQITDKCFTCKHWANIWLNKSIFPSFPVLSLKSVPPANINPQQLISSAQQQLTWEGGWGIWLQLTPSCLRKSSGCPSPSSPPSPPRRRKRLFQILFSDTIPPLASVWENHIAKQKDLFL